MSQISDIINPWREILLNEPASFRGVIFHVDSGTRSSGRRTVLHEYPKRNDPYAEDMGRIARHFTFSGYLIYRPRNPQYNYVQQRQNLYQALEQDDAGRLIHPVFAKGGMQVVCERFSMTESREKGGFTQFDMSFVEAGKSVSFEPQQVNMNTASVVGSTATAAEAAVKSMLNVFLSLVR